MERPDLKDLELGAIYEDTATGEPVVYLGRAVLDEFNGETVGVFQFTEFTGGEGLLVATRRDYDNGQRFVPFGDVVEQRIR